MNRQTALFFTAPYQVELWEQPLPALSPNQVRVQTLLSAVSAGTEMLLYRGQMPNDLPLDTTIAGMSQPFHYPVQYGYATVGQIVECGTNIPQNWQTQLIFAFAPHQTSFVTDFANLIPLPAHISPENALFLPNMETAVSFLMDGQPIIGEQVIVLGQGIVGLLTTALLARYPLQRLVTADSYDYRRQQSLNWGASASFAPEQLLAELENQRADLTYELSGNPAALNLAIEVTGYAGKILIGSWYGQKPVTLQLGSTFHRNHQQIISSQVSHLHPRWSGRWTKQRRLELAWQMLHILQPATLISHRIPFTQAPTAYHLLHHQPETILQLIFDYHHSPNNSTF